MDSRQLSLFGFMGLAIALRPGLVLKWNEAGVSSYGDHLKTVVPYSLALALAGVLAVGASRASAHDPSRRALRWLLDVYGVLMLATLVSTYGYTSNPIVRSIHVAVNVTTALYLSGASLSFFRRTRATRVDAGWLVVQLLGLTLAIVDYVKLLHVLFMAQPLAGVGFGVLSVRALRRLEITARAI